MVETPYVDRPSMVDGCRPRAPSTGRPPYRCPRGRRADRTGRRRSRPSAATVVVATGHGLAALFEAEGAAVVAGPNPSTAEILAAIRAHRRDPGRGAARRRRAPRAPPTAAAAEARGEGIRVVDRADPVAGAGAGRARRTRRRPALRGRRDRDGRGGRRLPVRRGDPRQPRGAHGRRPLPAGRRAGAGRGRGQPDRLPTSPQTCRDLLDRLLAGGGELVTLLTGAQAPDDLADRSARAPRPALAVRGGRRSTTAASRTTRCWSASSERRSRRSTSRHADRRWARVVGDKTGARRSRTHLELRTVGDLLYHFPRRYDERGEHTEIRTLRSASRSPCWPRCGRRTSARSAAASDTAAGGDRRRRLRRRADPDVLRQRKQVWRERDLRPGRWGMFAGTVTEFRGKRQLNCPDYVLLATIPTARRPARSRSSPAR